MQDARAELSDAQAELRVERHTIQQLQADIAHRAQQFQQLKEQISAIQENMEESRKANEVFFSFMVIPLLNHITLSISASISP